MFVLDDLLLRPFVGLLQTLRVTALNELYDLDDINDRLKENQLLYELGERSRTEYERERTQLERERVVAERIHEQVGARVQVKR